MAKLWASATSAKSDVSEPDSGSRLFPDKGALTPSASSSEVEATTKDALYSAGNTEPETNARPSLMSTSKEGHTSRAAGKPSTTAGSNCGMTFSAGDCCCCCFLAWRLTLLAFLSACVAESSAALSLRCSNLFCKLRETKKLTALKLQGSGKLAQKRV